MSRRGTVDAKGDGAATAESEGTVDGMAAAATALAGAADGSVVDDAGANGTAEAKADDAAEAEGGGSGACGAGDAKGDGEANGNGNGPAHGEANGNGNGPAHTECNCENTCIGAKDASQPTVTAHKLTVWRTKPAAHEPKSTRPTAHSRRRGSRGRRCRIGDGSDCITVAARRQGRRCHLRGR